MGFGAEVGYDIVVSDSLVVGPYANYDLSTIEDCAEGFCVSSGNYWAAGVHVGFALDENGMIYGKIGYGQQTIKAEGPVEITPGTIEFFDADETGSGYNFAFGYEHSFGETFYGRAELSISESSDIFGLDFQRSSLGVAMGARF